MVAARKIQPVGKGLTRKKYTKINADSEVEMTLMALRASWVNEYEEKYLSVRVRYNSRYGRETRHSGFRESELLSYEEV